MGLLAATGGELEACLRAGADPGRIVMHGNNKSDAEIGTAVGEGVRFLIVDNPEELERADALARAGERPSCRSCSGPSPRSTPTPTPTSTREDGTPSSARPSRAAVALQALKLAESLSGLDLQGIHVHVGSQLVGPEAHLGGVDAALDLLAEARDALGRELPVLDAGGGFGVRYTDESPPTPAEFAAAIHARVAGGRRGARPGRARADRRAGPGDRGQPGAHPLPGGRRQGRSPACERICRWTGA